MAGNLFAAELSVIEYATNYEQQKILLANSINSKEEVEKWLPRFNLPSELVAMSDEQNTLATETSLTSSTQGSSPSGLEAILPSEPLLPLLSTKEILVPPSKREQKLMGYKSQLDKLEQQKNNRDLTVSEKQERCRLRNIFFSQKSKDNKKERLKSLEKQLEVLTEENDCLKKEHADILGENKSLKQDLEKDLDMLIALFPHLKDQPALSNNPLLLQQTLSSLLFSAHAAATIPNVLEEEETRSGQQFYY